MTALSAIALLAAALATPVEGSAPAAPAPSSVASTAAASRKVEFTPVPQMEAMHVANPHEYKGKPLCQRCHVPGEQNPSRDPVALCVQCHEAGRMKHPWGMVPAKAPAGLPLTRDGRVACHTCHDPHAVKARRGGLRLEYGELCLRCHTGHSSR